MNFSLETKKSTIHAIRFGSGNQLLICFHGFGEEAEKYKVLEDSLSERYTVIAIDLPFHGKTEWKQGDLFMKEDLEDLISQILRQEQKQRFSLLGYSLGGKLVMNAVLVLSSQIDAVILIAPDGVKSNAWYNLAVYPEWGRKLFHRFVKRPQFVFSTARMLKAIGIMSDRFYKFLQLQVDTEVKRRKVYDVWLTIKDFEVELEEVKLLLNRNHIKCYIFIGKYDQVITTKIGELFVKGLQNCHYVVLEKGHNLISESLNEPLKQAFNK